MNSRRTPRSVTGYHKVVWVVLSLLLFCLIAFLRLSNLATNPGWYPDEGSDLDIARHFALGQWQYFSLGGTLLVAGRVPLFHLFLALGFKIWGYDIATARLVVALFDLATIALLFFAVRDMLGKRAALLSGLMLGILPNTILYSRIAFAYNVQAFFVVLCWYTLWKFYVKRQSIWLLCAALAAAAGYMTALTGLPLVICVLIVALLSRSRLVIWALPLMLAPGLIYLGLLGATAPAALLQDLALTFGRTSDSLGAQFFNLISNYVLWFDWTFWIVLGISGLYLIPARSVRWLTLLVFLTVLLNIMRAFPTAGELYLHRYLGILPLLALGCAQFLLSAISFVYAQIRSDFEAWRLASRFNWFPRKQWVDSFTILLLVLLVVMPVVWLALWDVYLVAAPLAPRPTRLDFVSVTNPSDARQITDWVNARTRADDVVLASPTIAWLIAADAADFQQALAYEGLTTPNYGAGLPRRRFEYDVSFENAKYVIVDGVWRGWAVENMPELRNYLRTVESWSRVKSQGEFEVYQNPNR